MNEKLDSSMDALSSNECNSTQSSESEKEISPKKSTFKKHGPKSKKSPSQVFEKPQITKNVKDVPPSSKKKNEAKPGSLDNVPELNKKLDSSLHLNQKPGLKSKESQSNKKCDHIQSSDFKESGNELLPEKSNLKEIQKSDSTRTVENISSPASKKDELKLDPLDNGLELNKRLESSRPINQETGTKSNEQCNPAMLSGIKESENEALTKKSNLNKNRQNWKKPLSQGIQNSESTKIVEDVTFLRRISKLPPRFYRFRNPAEVLRSTYPLQNRAHGNPEATVPNFMLRNIAFRHNTAYNNYQNISTSMGRNNACTSNPVFPHYPPTNSPRFPIPIISNRTGLKPIILPIPIISNRTGLKPIILPPSSGTSFFDRIPHIQMNGTPNKYTPGVSYHKNVMPPIKTNVIPIGFVQPNTNFLLRKPPPASFFPLHPTVESRLTPREIQRNCFRFPPPSGSGHLGSSFSVIRGIAPDQLYRHTGLNAQKDYFSNLYVEIPHEDVFQPMTRDNLLLQFGSTACNPPPPNIQEQIMTTQKDQYQSTIQNEFTSSIQHYNPNITTHQYESQSESFLQNQTIEPQYQYPIIPMHQYEMQYPPNLQNLTAAEFQFHNPNTSMHQYRTQYTPSLQNHIEEPKYQDPGNTVYQYGLQFQHPMQNFIEPQYRDPNGLTEQYKTQALNIPWSSNVYNPMYDLSNQMVNLNIKPEMHNTVEGAQYQDTNNPTEQYKTQAFNTPWSSDESSYVPAYDLSNQINNSGTIPEEAINESSTSMVQDPNWQYGSSYLNYPLRNDQNLMPSNSTEQASENKPLVRLSEYPSELYQTNESKNRDWSGDPNENSNLDQGYNSLNDRENIDPNLDSFRPISPKHYKEWSRTD